VIQLRVHRPETGLELPPIPFSWFDEARSHVEFATKHGELPAASDPTAVTRMLIDATFGVHQLNYRSPRRTQKDYDALWMSLLVGMGARDPESVVTQTRELIERY
jgi:hypothetical protein